MRMKPSFPKPERKPVDAVTARNAALVNQLATPGLGSLMAGRWIAGSGQLALAVAGCVMAATWFVEVMVQLYESLSADAQMESNYRFLKVGVILFATAWLWALATSVNLLRQARTSERTKPMPPLRAK